MRYDTKETLTKVYKTINIGKWFIAFFLLVLEYVYGTENITDAWLVAIVVIFVLALVQGVIKLIIKVF